VLTLKKKKVVSGEDVVATTFYTPAIPEIESSYRDGTNQPKYCTSQTHQCCF